MKKFSPISAAILILILMAKLVISVAVEKPICTDLNDRRYAAISGTRIVWAHVHNGYWDIYLYDLATRIATPISTDPSFQRHPAISGDRIGSYGGDRREFRPNRTRQLSCHNEGLS